MSRRVPQTSARNGGRIAAAGRFLRTPIEGTAPLPAMVPIASLLLLCGFSAGAFVDPPNSGGEPLRWHLDPPDPSDPPNPGGISTNVVNPVTRAVRFFLAADGYSATNTVAELNAVRASFAQWQAIPGTVLKFEDGGLVPAGVDINTGDNRNVVFWAKTSTLVNGGFDNIDHVLALTVNSYYPDSNAQAEADIVFNGVQYRWSTDFNSGDTTSYFIEATAAHEIGHFLGLKHAPAGGATMFFRGAGGVNVQAGLSSDEISAAKWLYGRSSTLAALGRVQGRVTMNGSAVFGAAVFAESPASGILVAGTVSGQDGAYDLPALPPGPYGVRVTPLDPVAAGAYLARGRDISSEKDDATGNYIFDAAETGFLPTTNVPVAVTGGATATANFTVAAGSPAFRIAYIRPPTTSADPPSPTHFPAALRPGQSNYFIGVASTNLPTNNVSLTITGDGLTLGPPVVSDLFGIRIISVPINVSSNATPGLRSFIVQRGTDLAYANGFLDIQPAVPDFNFDGLDDRFQRQYFPLFTAPEAGPNADPDGDSLDNRAESVAGTDPTSALSLLKIDRVVLDANGSRLSWESVLGKRYQVFSRLDLQGALWQAVGSPVTASGATTEFLDVTSTNRFRFYRVAVLP